MNHPDPFPRVPTTTQVRVENLLQQFTTCSLAMQELFDIACEARPYQRAIFSTCFGFTEDIESLRTLEQEKAEDEVNYQKCVNSNNPIMITIMILSLLFVVFFLIPFTVIVAPQLAFKIINAKARGMDSSQVFTAVNCGFYVAKFFEHNDLPPAPF